MPGYTDDLSFEFDFIHIGWWDIGYSFLIGEDGNVYEGRGWDVVGAHTKGYNDVGLAFSILGNFTSILVRIVTTPVVTSTCCER